MEPNKQVRAHPVKKVSGLHQLGPERIEADIWSIELPVVTFGKATKLLPDAVVDGMMTYGLLDIAVQYLKPEKRNAE